MHSVTSPLLITKSVLFHFYRNLGELVDHADLTDALQRGTIAGAGLDLTEPNPLPSSHPLLKMPNVIITPHCSSLTVDMAQKMMQSMMYNLSKALPKD